VIDRVWAFLIALNDKAFRTAVLLILLGMGYAQWQTWRAVKAVAADRALEARIVTLEREHAVDHEKITSLERQVSALWRRPR